MARAEGKFSRAWNYSKQEWSAFGRTVGGFATSLQNTGTGRAFSRGAAMGFGFELKEGIHGSNVYKGVLGLKGNVSYRSRFRAMNRMLRRGGVSAAGKIGFGLLAKAAGPLSTAYDIYSGYQEGGIVGAAKGGAEAALMWGGFEMATYLLGSTAVPLAAIAAAGGYGAYLFADKARDYGKTLKKVNMGAPIVDTFGTVATTRQRSLMALQNTHINGRMALGNEGMLMHTNIYSRS